MTYRVGIIGGTGYTGSELSRLLVRHPDVELAALTSRSNAGVKVSKVNTFLKGYTDIEFTAEAIMDCAEHPFIEAPSLGMGAGKVIRVVGAEKLDDSQWQGKWHVVATFENEIDALPNIVFTHTDGTVLSSSNGWNNWTFRISSDGKSLEFKCLHGAAIIMR